MELLIAIPIAIIILYLKGHYQQFFYYGKDPLKGYGSFIYKEEPVGKKFIGFLTKEKGYGKDV